jgi:hypothetical protein
VEFLQEISCFNLLFLKTDTMGACQLLGILYISEALFTAAQREQSELIMRE